MDSTPGAGLVAAPDDVAERILTSVAAREGCDALDLPPLYDVVDTDALEGLFRSGGGDADAVTVTFDYHGYRITVDESDVSLSHL